MRAVELRTVPAEDVLAYVKGIHPTGEFNIDYTITDHPRWHLARVPLHRLHIPNEAGEYPEDPYNRVQMIDMDHVENITRQDIEQRPIVVGPDGHIIDGNHRALAAKFGGLFDIPAYIPVK